MARPRSRRATRAPGALRALLLLAFLMSGCALGREAPAPAMVLEARYARAPAADASRAAPPLARWWEGFHDADLDRAVASVLAGNLDLEAARARLVEARALARAAGAKASPEAALSGSAAAVSQSLESPFGALARQLPGFRRDYALYDLGAAASWEIDLFGGIAAGTRAAGAEAEASADDLGAARALVIAETADVFVQIRAFEARRQVARRQEALEEQLLALVRLRRSSGVASERELHQTEAALEGVRARIPALLAGEEAQRDRMRVLMGAPAESPPPGAFIGEAPEGNGQPAPPPLTALGGPSDLLRQRPDVRAAERRLAASRAGVTAALSAYYPSLSISGLLGFESVSLGQALGPSALQHAVTAGLRWRLFEFGRIDAEVAGARGREAEALARYRGAVVRATGEVETGLSALIRAEEEVGVLDQEVADLERARSQAEEAYRGGVISLIEVLDADRELLAASDLRVGARADAARAAIASFRAAGGGG